MRQSSSHENQYYYVYRIAGNFRGVSNFVVKIPVTKFDCTRMCMRRFACVRILEARKLLLTAEVCIHVL